MRGSIEKRVCAVVANALGVPAGAVSLDTILVSDLGGGVSWGAIEDGLRSAFGAYVSLGSESTPKVSDIVAVVKPNIRDSGVKGFAPTIREKVAEVIASVVGWPACAISSNSRMHGDKYDVDVDGLKSREALVRSTLACSFDIADDFIELGKGALVSDVVAAIEAALESGVDRATACAKVSAAYHDSRFGFAVEAPAEAVA